MSGVSLLMEVGGTQMVVAMDDHFRPLPARTPLTEVMVTCRHCGVLVLDYVVHLVHHIEVLKDFSLMVEEAEAVMPQDVHGDEIGAPERPAARNLGACKACGHVHLSDMGCGQPWRGSAATLCPCTVVQ